MKNKVYILLVLILLAALFATPSVAADSEPSQERQVKAAFVYNFINFVDWPKEKMPDSNEPIIIGIVGDKDFVKYFDPVKDKQIKNKNIAVKYFDGFPKTKKSKEKDNSQWNQKIEALKKCHILMFSTCDSEEIFENPGRIIKALEGSSVLTVGDTAGFLEAGGIINLLVEDEKVRFEINLDLAKHNNLKIRAKLLKLAKRVIEEEKKSKDIKS
jgi:ribosomal protein L14E/L6E/L27E